MRDYKQMQEIQKLKQQAEADPSVGDGERDEKEKYSRRSPGFKGWLAYIGEYYKWPIIFGVVILFGLIVGAVQIGNTSNPDLCTMYVGPFYLTPTEQDKLEVTLANLSGENAGDYNGDGEFRFDFLDITISHLTDADGVQYTYDDQNNAYTRFQTELRAGDTLLYFLEPYYYRQALSAGILMPLSEIGVDDSISPDGYGIHIGDLDCYELDGLSRMPAEAVLCLRRSPDMDAIEYGRTMENWEHHRDMFIALVNYRSETRVLDTETPSDVTLFYAGEQPVYKSIRFPVEQSLSQLVTDENGDGKKKGSIRAITRSGTEAEWEVASKAIRTELITGDEFLLLLDEEAFLYAVEHGLLEELPEALRNASGAKDGFGLKLSALEVYNTEGYHELSPLSYLCLRKSPEGETESYGRTQEDYLAAKQVFEKLAKIQEKSE